MFINDYNWFFIPTGTSISELEGTLQKKVSLMVVYKDRVSLYWKENKSADRHPVWQCYTEIARKLSEQYVTARVTIQN
jgi:hypothetical protein